jgi:hypothetical protein
MTLAEHYKKDIDAEITPEAAVIDQATALMKALVSVNRLADVVHPGNTTQYFKLPVEFGGFCPVTLMKYDGLAVPGDKNIGMIRHRERLFAFGDMAAAIEFCKHPDEYIIIKKRYIEKVINLSKLNPSYVQLLHLYKFFPTVDLLEKVPLVLMRRDLLQDRD